MKISPITPNNAKYSELWKSAIRRIILHLKIVRMMRKDSIEEENFTDYILERSSRFNRSKTNFFLPFGIFHPGSRYKEAWNIYMSILLMYTAIVIPFVFSFYDDVSEGLQVVDMLIDSSFIFDIFWSLNTAYYDEDNLLESSRLRILKNYLKNGLVLDSISSIPFSFIDAAIQKYSNFIRIIRLRSLWRLIKLSRIFKLMSRQNFSMVKRLQVMLSISQSFARLIKFLCMIIIVIHLAACAWHWSAKYENYGVDTWVFRLGALDNAIHRKYLLSLYWAVFTLATIGYGGIYPFTATEKILCISWIAFAFYFFTFAISSLNSMLSQIDFKKTLLRQRMTFVDDFSKQVKLSKRLKRELQKQVLKIIEQFSFSYEDRINLVKEFPKDLQTEITFTMQKGFAARFDLFESEPDSLLIEILPLLQNISVSAMQIIYSYGEPSNNIYFLIRGRVHYLLENERTIFQVFSEGTYFGDTELFLGLPRLNSVAAACDCRLMVMGTDILKKIQTSFVDFYAKMNRLASRRYHVSQRAKAEMKMLVNLSYKQPFIYTNVKKVKEIIKRETIKMERKDKILKNKQISHFVAYRNLNETKQFIFECRETIKKINELINGWKKCI